MASGLTSPSSVSICGLSEATYHRKGHRMRRDVMSEGRQMQMGAAAEADSSPLAEALDHFLEDRISLPAYSDS